MNQVLNLLSAVAVVSLFIKHPLVSYFGAGCSWIAALIVALTKPQDVIVFMACIGYFSISISLLNRVSTGSQQQKKIEA